MANEWQTAQSLYTGTCATCDPPLFYMLYFLYELYASVWLLLHVYWFFTLHVACKLTFPLSFVFLSLYNILTLFTFTKWPSLPKTLHFHTTTPSQRVSELLNWPVSEAKLEQALFPSTPELPVQTAKRELRIIEFMKKMDPRSPIFSGIRR